MYESFVQNEVLQKVLSTSSNVWITCVPLHEKRYMKRGYNQSEILGRKLAEKMNLKFNGKIMKRVKNTIAQFKLRKEEREKNIKDAFRLNPKYTGKIRGKTIFIVDDVLTSGATLRECGKLLKKEGAKQAFGLILSMEQ